MTQSIAPPSQQIPAESLSHGQRALRAFLRNPNAVAGLLILTVMGLMGLSAPLLFPGDPLSITGAPFQWPFATEGHPLGTDNLGRDVLAGIAHGARVSLMVGFVATFTGLAIGIVMGAWAGYYGGWVDEILTRIVEVFQTIPNFIFLVVVVAIVPPSTVTLAVSIGLVSWPSIARLVRAEFRAHKAKDYITCARTLGYSDARIIFHEILPNALPPIIVTASIMVASAILMESALSFMGLGDPNLVSWGSMIGAGKDSLRTAWYLTALPGFAIVLTVVALNLLGDGLNDALNPRLMNDA